MLDARSLALTPQARLRAATTPILSIYIYLFIKYKGHALTNGRGCAAQAGLIPRPDLHWPRWPILPTSNAHNPIPLIYISLSAHARYVAMRKAYGSDSHRRADEQPIIFWRYFRKYIL